MFSTVKNYMDLFESLLDPLGIETKTLDIFLEEKIKEHEREK